MVGTGKMKVGFFFFFFFFKAYPNEKQFMIKLCINQPKKNS